MASVKLFFCLPAVRMAGTIITIVDVRCYYANKTTVSSTPEILPFRSDGLQAFLNYLLDVEFSAVLYCLVSPCDLGSSYLFKYISSHGNSNI